MKNNRSYRKSICLVMALLLFVGLFAGCTGPTTVSTEDDPNEQVTLTIALPLPAQKDTDLVVAEINKQLETLLPNTKIDLMLNPNMAEQWPLWMSTHKVIDIAHSGYITKIEDEVRKDTYLELNELIDKYAPSIKALQEKYWYSYDNASINGMVYAIPNIQYHVKETLILRVDYAAQPYMDMQALITESYASDKTTEKFYQIYTAGLEKAEAAGVDVKSKVDTVNLLALAKRGYNFVGGESSTICYDNSDAGKIIDFTTTQEFKTYCKYAKIWADKGWVSKDILTGSIQPPHRTATGTRFNMDETTHEIIPQSAAAKDVGYYSYDLNNLENQSLVTNIGENMTYYSIPFTAAHPARAMRFLDLINSEAGKPILNLLAYGIEGKHYEVLDAEKGNIKAFEYQGQGGATVSYGLPNWEVGNMLLQYNVAPYTHINKEYGENFYADTINRMKKHVLYGYTFDMDPIKNDLSKVLKNNSEYIKNICSGVVGNEENLLEELTNKNAAAGLDRIIAEFQKQADNYIAGK